MKAPAIAIMAMLAFASGANASLYHVNLWSIASVAFANTETERQCFGQTEACAAPANDGALLLLADCIEPGEYGDCVRGCESIYDACMVTAANDKDAENCARSLESCITSNITGCRKKC